MRNKVKYVTIDRVFSKLNRDLRGHSFQENDIIEWAGEALEDMNLSGALEEIVALLKVQNYEVDIPEHFQTIIRLFKLKETTLNKIEVNKTKEVKEKLKLFKPDVIVGTYKLAEVYKELENTVFFVPIRPTNNDFFNTVVFENSNRIYKPNQYYPEYTIIGTTEKKIRLSFKEGVIAFAYLRRPIDETNGYPLIPDDIDCINAIVYYIKFKISEWYSWNGKQGYESQKKEAFMLYERSLAIFNSKMKLPQNRDEYEAINRTWNYLINPKK